MAIPQPEPADWLRANAQELAVTDRQVLALLRATRKRVEAILADLPQGKQEVRRAQLENTRARLLAEQADLFERLGDVVEARRARAASRSARLSAASDAALLSLVGKGEQAQYLYDRALDVSQRSIDAALQRMKFSALPLSRRIYNTNVWMAGRLGKLINETLASGINAREFARRARDWFSPSTPGGVRYAAMRLARTEINNAFHSMSAQKYAETPWISEVEWNLSKSHPKPDECDEYAKQSPYKSDETPARPHPQCMCYITPKSIDENEFVDNFLKGDYDDYIDRKLEQEGWIDPEPEPEPTPPPPAPQGFPPPFALPPLGSTPPAVRPTASQPRGSLPELQMSDESWDQLFRRMEEIKANPTPPAPPKRRVKPADRPDGAKIAGRGRVEAPAEESAAVREIGFRISDKVSKKMQAKIKRVLAISETHIGERIKRVSSISNGIPKNHRSNDSTTFAVAFYDSGSVHLHSKLDAKGGEIAGCCHSGHLVKGGDDAHETVLAHEFGHVFLSKGRLNTEAINDLLHVVSEALDLPSGFRPDQQIDDRSTALETLDRLVQMDANQERIEKLVSRYARTNANEFFAEIWSEYTMNPDASPEIRKIGDRMKEYITQERKGLSALTY